MQFNYLPLAFLAMSLLQTTQAAPVANGATDVVEPDGRKGYQAVPEGLANVRRYAVERDTIEPDGRKGYQAVPEGLANVRRYTVERDAVEPEGRKGYNAVPEDPPTS